MSKPRWRQQLRRSLGLRLVLLFLLLALATTAIFLVGMQRALSGGWSGLVRPLVSDYVDRLAAEIGSPPDVARAQDLVRRLPLSVRIEGPSVQWDSQPQRRAGWHRGPDEDDGRWLLQRQTADGHRITFGLGDRGWVRRPRTIGWATLGALLLLTGVAYAYARHLFRPLDDIRAGAQRFGQGSFDAPIPVRRHDELGELAEQVNTMARDIRAMLDAKRGLLLAVSHELRSPLTRARLNAELVAPGSSRDALLRDLGEMRDLITDLLESERLAAGHAALQRERLDLNALVRAVVDEQFATAGLQLDLDAQLPPLDADPARLRLLLRNLIDNALRHGGREPPPRIATTLRDGRVRLSVRDHGPGVAAAELSRLSEAFYRPDAARARSTGGVGLGLHLCRMVAQAHGGALHIANAGPGLEVVLSLPQAS
ncbi:MAG: HAMP domain-containing histidine kinase [Rubrivivax sp.]|nr:HAMP domain-containing histidine kinase [Rubrivivax sp.]